MGYLATVQDIVNDTLKKAGEKVDGTSPYAADALEHVQKLYEALLSGGNEFDINLAEPWAWAKSKYPGILILEPAVDVLVTLAADSDSGTFAVAPSVSYAGRRLKVANRPDWVRIEAHLAGQTAFTLDADYADDTGSGLSAQVVKLDYELDAASILRQIGRLRVARTQESGNNDPSFIDVLDFRAFDGANPWSEIKKGVPTQAGIIFVEERDSGNVITLRFNRYPSQKTRIEYDFIAVPADLTLTSTVLIPRSHREVLSYGAAHKLLVEKNDTNAEYFLKGTKAKIQGLVNANRKSVTQNSGNTGQFYPRLSGRQSKITSGGY